MAMSIIPAADRRKIKHLVDEHGINGAAERLKINRVTLMRALGGLEVQAGTHALIDREIGKIDA